MIEVERVEKRFGAIRASIPPRFSDGLGQVGNFTSLNWTNNKVINQGVSGLDEAPGPLYDGAAFYSRWSREN